VWLHRGTADLIDPLGGRLAVLGRVEVEAALSGWLVFLDRDAMGVGPGVLTMLAVTPDTPGPLALVKKPAMPLTAVAEPRRAVPAPVWVTSSAVPVESVVRDVLEVPALLEAPMTSEPPEAAPACVGLPSEPRTRPARPARPAPMTERRERDGSIGSAGSGAAGDTCSGTTIGSIAIGRPSRRREFRWTYAAAPSSGSSTR
jgi:hypothetical protein